MSDFFDKNFFIIDSENLASVSSKFYGYYLNENGLFCENNFDLNDSNLTGRGCYVFVHREEDTITISQDFMGSYGLYLFHHDDYFALSNSFNFLLDHIKQKYPVSFSRDYANHFLLMDLVSLSFSDTIINEIKMLPKSAKVSISIAAKKLSIEYIDYKEDSISLDSREGLETLDRWYESWIKIIRNINNHTNQLTIDLSGGFDSRLSFLLVKCSGISLDDIRVNSINDNLHTHTEDYKIATEISKKFNFQLNKKLPQIHYQSWSLDKIIKTAWNTMIPFHKEIYYKQAHSFETRFRISGAGGESVREYWNYTPDELAEIFCNPAMQNYPQNIGQELYDSCRKVLFNSIEEIKELYNFAPEDKSGLSISSMLYRQIRCRNHFGRSALHDFLTNCFVLTPLCDPDLYKLRLRTFDCDDQNLLMALIYIRYCPELLEFPFDNDRCIRQETIDKANSINDRYPYEKRGIPNSNFYYPSFSQKKPDALLMENNKFINKTEVDNYMLRLFKSPVIKHTFLSHYDKTIYDDAENYYNTQAYFPMRYCNGIVSIAKTLQDASINQVLFQKFGKDYLDQIINNTHPEIQEETIPIVYRDYLAAKQELNSTNNYLKDVLSSTSWKIGSLITWLPAMLKRKIKKH